MASTSLHSTLADVFLTRIPADEQPLTVRNLAANITNETTGLVAALIEKCPDEEADSYLNSFLIRSIEKGETASAVALCIQFPKVRDSILNWAERELHICFLQLLQKPKNAGFVVPVEKVLRVDPFVDRYDPVLGFDRETEDLVTFTLYYLDFVKQLFRSSSPDDYFVVSTPLVCAVFGFVASSSPEVATAAKDAALAFLGAFRANAFTFSHFKQDPDELDRHLWRCIMNLLDPSLSSSYKTTAYTLWLRWLDLESHGHSRQYALQSDNYWQYLLATLGQVLQGDTEQRKACLHILKKSLAITRNNIRANDMELMLDTQDQPGSKTAQAEYGRFCTVYETIVIGRYLNQALECVKDLDILASPDTIVQKSWLFALLECALSPVTQDSMRKMLGNWLMSTDVRLTSHAEEFAHLLQNSFLPWATQGPLFTGTVQGKTREMRIAHGTRLASFFERLLKNHVGREDTYSRKCIVDAVLIYLSNNKNRMVPIAVLYLLQGLIKGLEEESVQCMETDSLTLILDLSRHGGYPEIASNALLVQCHKLSKLVSQEPPTPTVGMAAAATVPVDAKLKTLAKQMEGLQLDAPRKFDLDQDNSTRWTSIDQFLDELKTSNYTCIHGDGLQMACKSLTIILDETKSGEMVTSSLNTALDYVWNEIERQDYPKDVLMLLPRLVMHPACVAGSLDDEALADTVVQLVSQLRRLIKGRIYLWAPVMKTYRTAILCCPRASGLLGLEDFIVDIANNPPAAKIEFKLEAAALQILSESGEAQRSYSDYYGEHEEVGYAAFFDLVNRLGQVDVSVVDNVYDKLLQPWTTQRPPVPIIMKWKSTTQLQVLLMLSEQRLTKLSAEEAQDQLRRLLRVVAIEPLPRYRFLLEWTISRIVVLHPSSGEIIIDALSTMDHHANPKYLGCLTKISLMLACLDDCPPDFAARVAHRLVALSSSSKIIIRHEAQWSFPLLWKHAEKQGWSDIISNPACVSLNDYIQSLERYSEPPPARELERLDPVADHNLSNLVQGKYLRLEPSVEALVMGNDFEQLWQQDESNKYLAQELASASLALGASSDTSTMPLKQTTQQETKASARTEAFAVAALQTKGSAYLAAENATSDPEGNARPTELLVVGSLVDNAYNLGGLSRISEIFGASALYMQNPHTVLANKDFVSVAVASQNHLPIHGLKLEELVKFLTEKKVEGYTVVGVEQTDRSVILGAEGTVLPKKTLLVMGAEKEGISAEILGECDLLVEIPQKGLTRSMNVQTACGCVLFEYARQHHSS